MTIPLSPCPGCGVTTPFVEKQAVFSFGSYRLESHLLDSMEWPGGVNLPFDGIVVRWRRPIVTSRPTHYRIRISLDGIAPAISRSVLVPADITLRRLQDLLRREMGWTDSRSYCFGQDGRELGRPDRESGIYVEDDSRFTLRYMLPGPGHTMSYRHYRGSSWVHTVVLEEMVWSGAVAQTVSMSLH